MESLRVEPAVPSFAAHGSSPLGPLDKSLLGQALSTDVTDKYEIKQVLGRGAFATTRLCIEKATGQRYACKSMLKSQFHDDESSAGVRRELQVMEHLIDCPNVVRLVDTFEDNAYVHLVMELCSGGDLVHRLIEKGNYTERDAAAIMRRLLTTIAYTHDMGCMHRDIKPDNCLMTDESDSAEMKVADWGYAAFVHPGHKLHEVVGTSYYIAPEVLSEEGYTEKADVWSCGVMLYVLLCGHPPFYAANDWKVLELIRNDGVPNMSREPWPHISDYAKEAVSQMMSPQPDIRPSAREMLDHPWIREDGVAGDNVIQPEVLRRLRGFAAMNQLKRQAALVIASHLPEDQIQGLRELFNSMDRDGSGTISKEELKIALEERGCRVLPEDLDRLVQTADVDGNGEVDYHEFLASTLHQSRLEEEENLVLAFKHFDLDGDGKISTDELRQAMASTAHGDDANVTNIMAAVDLDGDQQIDYIEFVRLMKRSRGMNGASSSGVGLGLHHLTACMSAHHHTPTAGAPQPEPISSSQPARVEP